MPCNCGGSARATEQQRQTQAELAARRQNETTQNHGVFGAGYYFTGQDSPPVVEAPPIKKQPVPAE
jgi:hypothetical protein